MDSLSQPDTSEDVVESSSARSSMVLEVLDSRVREGISQQLDSLGLALDNLLCFYKQNFLFLLNQNQDEGMQGFGADSASLMTEFHRGCSEQLAALENEKVALSQALEKLRNTECELRTKLQLEQEKCAKLQAELKQARARLLVQANWSPNVSRSCERNQEDVRGHDRETAATKRNADELTALLKSNRELREKLRAFGHVGPVGNFGSFGQNSSKVNSLENKGILGATTAAPASVTTPVDRQRRRDAIRDTIVPPGQISFSDVAGLQEAKSSLADAIIIPIRYPQLFTGSRQPWRRILLYGPPGTGKSRLARALASEIQAPFYSVSSADLISSWLGESEKLVRELFQHANSQIERSVIFIDEIDSMCRQRSSSEEGYARRIKTEFLRQMEGVDDGKTSQSIFLLCATNCPWELDSAFLQRFQKRIYIPQPSSSARVALMRIHTRDSRIQLTDQDWLQLAQYTEGYSGRDLHNLTLAALYEPVRELQSASHWKETDGGKWMPAEVRNEPGTVKGSLQQIPADQVETRPVTLRDFENCLQVHRATVSQIDLEKFQAFTKAFGQLG